MVKADGPELSNVKKCIGIKQAMRTMTKHTRELEQSFSSAADVEAIIDPIAVYSII